MARHPSPGAGGSSTQPGQGDGAGEWPADGAEKAGGEAECATDDDPAQARQVAALLGGDEEVFVPKTVLLELEWVLRAVYDLPRDAVGRSILHVLGLPQVRPENPEQVAFALDQHARGLGFADALHLAAGGAARPFFTFDARFARTARALGAAVETL
ncbi:MAG: type II toxin-antitoxin system VapC family toxin [Deferrisomatales bacterium]